MNDHRNEWKEVTFLYSLLTLALEGETSLKASLRKAEFHTKCVVIKVTGTMGWNKIDGSFSGNHAV